MRQKETATRTRTSQASPSKALAAPTPVVGPRDDEGLLTAAEGRVLDVMLQPESRRKTVSELCDSAGVSRSHYHRLMARPEFREKVVKLSTQMATDQLGPVFEALQTSALILGKEGHADRKLLLEMLGAHQPSRRQIIEEVRPKQTDAQLVAWFLEMEVPFRKWIPGVLRRYQAGMVEGHLPPPEHYSPRAGETFHTCPAALAARSYCQM